MKLSHSDYFSPIQPALSRFVNAKRAIIAISLALVLNLEAGPVSVEELSLLVRTKESEASILNQVTQRKMVRALEPQQEATLKAQGASETLLQAVRDPKVRLSDADAIAYEKWRDMQKGIAQLNVPDIIPTQLTGQRLIVDAVSARRAPLPLPVTLEPAPSLDLPMITDDAGAASGVDLIIEKVIIQNPPPVPAPYYVWIQAKTGRAEVTFNVPGKTFGNEVATSDIEIPLNIRIRNVQLNDWATVKFQFDKQDAAVRSIAPLKRASARIEITKDPRQRGFSGMGDENENFVYQLTWHAEDK